MNEQKSDSEDRKLRNKLTRVISKAGLSWMIYGSIVDYSDNLPGNFKTAVWIYDKVSKKEKILFHKDLLNALPVNLLVVVLRHELLHKTMYRNIKGATNLYIVNYALDAAINKILFLSNHRNIIKLAKIMFIHDRLGLTCVMNPSITTDERNKLDTRLKRIFDEIYLTKKEIVTRTDSGHLMTEIVDVTCNDVLDKPFLFNSCIPEPLTLYNKLCSILSLDQKKEIAKLYSWITDTNRDKGSNSKIEDVKDKFKDKDKETETEKETEKADNDTVPVELDSPGESNEKEEKEEEKEEESQKSENIEKPVNEEKPKEKPEENKEDIDHTPTHQEISEEDFGTRILPRGGPNVNRASDNKTLKREEENSKIIIGDNYSCYSNLKSYFEKYVYFKKEAETRGLDDFISKWQTEKQIENVVNTIYNEIKNRTSLDPIPIELTRTGFELVVLDVCGPDKVPMYFNENKQGAKKKICCYFDTSPSMNIFIPYMLSIIDFLNNCEECEISGGEYNGRYCFSEKVEGIDDWQAFMDGKVTGGFGTSFEIVVQHAIHNINENDVDIIIVMTDGLSGVNSKTIEKFNETNKKCYTIYFADPQKSYNFHHNRYGEGKEEDMHSDLDQLNGDNFTILVNTSEEQT